MLVNFAISVINNTSFFQATKKNFNKHFQSGNVSKIIAILLPFLSIESLQSG